MQLPVGVVNSCYVFHLHVLLSLATLNLHVLLALATVPSYTALDY